MSPDLFSVWVQTAQRIHSSAQSVGSETQQELMVVEVLEEARPQLRNESHARGYTTLDFEVGPPPPPRPTEGPEETAPRQPAVILESNVECATPKLTSLRRKSTTTILCLMVQPDLYYLVLIHSKVCLLHAHGGASVATSTLNNLSN